MRRSGRTTALLQGALEALRAGERVAFVVLDSDFEQHCRPILARLGASAFEIREIRFLNARAVDQQTRGWRGRVFWDHLVEERGFLNEVERARERCFPIPRVYCPTCWERLLGEDIC